MADFLRKKHFPKFAFFLFAILTTTILFFDRPSSSEIANSSPDRSALTSPFADREEYKNIIQLQEAFIRNAKKIKPSVVSINSITEVVNKTSHRRRNSFASKPWYSKVQDWWRKATLKKTYRVENKGSGIILNPQGYILTNYHVIEDVEKILVKLTNGREYFAKVVGTDALSDLSVLKISTLRRLPEPDLGHSEGLQVGEWVMAIGNPFGLEGTVTVGVISGKGRTDLGITTFENFLQTDASINSGNSGGPLINLQGQIIGINTAVAEIGSGVGFAIPIEMALEISEQIIQKGGVERGWLGLGIQSLTPELAASFHLPSSKEGVLVNKVQTQTPAEKSGFMRGDVIIQYNGNKIGGSHKFQRMVASTQVGKVIPIKVIREGKERILIVKVGRFDF